MNRRLVFASAFWVLLFVALIGAVAGVVWNRHQAVQTQLSEIEPRLARILGLRADKARLETTLRQGRAELTRHVYAVAVDASRAGNDAQQRAREIFAKSGLEVQSSQVLPARVTGRFELIPLTLKGEGDLPALQAALAAMPALAPTIFVNGIEIVVPPQPDKPTAWPRLSLQIELFVVRARE